MIDLSYAQSFYKWGDERPNISIISYCLKNLKFSGLITEFGVWEGFSTNFIAKNVYPLQVHAFDSFEGLERGWNDFPAGYFKIDYKKLKFNDNVSIYKGYFKDTLPAFVQEHKNERVSFINMDCDLYESAKDVLEILNPLIYPGTIIYFDELYNYKDYEEGELKALLNWSWKTDRIYRAIAFNDLTGVAIEILPKVKNSFYIKTEH